MADFFGIHDAINSTDIPDFNETAYTTNNDTLRPLDGKTEREYKCPTQEFYIYAVIAGSLCIFGFVGNSLSCWALKKDRQTPTASFLLQALAIADNIFLAFWFLCFSIPSITHFFGLNIDRLHFSWTYIITYSYPLLFIAQTVTIWLTVMIAVSRYVAICLPHRSVQVFNNTRRVRIATWIVVIASVLYNFPRFFEAYVVRENHNGTAKHLFTYTQLKSSYWYKSIYAEVLYYILTFVLPLLMLAVLNTKLTLAYRKILQRRRLMVSRNQQEDHNITLVLIIVVLVFILCQAPARLVQIFLDYKIRDCSSFMAILIFSANTLEVVNSSANFFIYCAFRKRFREILQAEFCSASECPHGNDTNAQEPLTTCRQNGHETKQEIIELATKDAEIRAKEADLARLVGGVHIG